MRMRPERLAAALLAALAVLGGVCAGPRAPAVPVGQAIDAQSVLVALPAVPVPPVGVPRPDPVPVEPPAPPARPGAGTTPAATLGPAAALSPGAVPHAGGRSPPGTARS